MAFVEDMAAFYGANDPGIVAATWNGTAAVLGELRRGYIEPLTGLVEGADPVFNCPAASVAGVKHGDTLVVDGTTYRVRGVQQDATGRETNLILEEQ